MTLLIETFGTQGPGDTEGLSAALRRLPLNRVRKLAVFGKTEGPATLNDMSRDLAQMATERAIRDVAGPAFLEKTWQIFSTGCEGIASPMTALVVDLGDEQPAASQMGLAFGAARSPALPAEERCGIRHVATAADTVRSAMQSAGLSAAQVSLVLIKSPVLSGNQAARAPGRLGRHAGSTGASRGAAALGAGIALEQTRLEALGDDPVGVTESYAERVMAFSGTETNCVETIVFGMRAGGDPAWAIESVHLADMLDVEALRSAIPGGKPQLLFFKAGIPPSGSLRGMRTTVLTSDLPADKQLRAAASGVVGACFGQVRAFISAGAEHQGAPGSSFCAWLRKNTTA
jgi:cyanuric acid amidohydrolase